MPSFFDTNGLMLPNHSRGDYRGGKKFQQRTRDSNLARFRYGAGQVVLAVAHFAGLLKRMTIGEAWVRNLISAMCCFSLSGLLRLGEFWVQHGTAGVR